MSAKGETPAPKFQAPPALTLREQLERGPRFIPLGGDDGERVDCICFTSCRPSGIDRNTRLCRDCWRAWRWSPVRERDIHPAR